MFNVIGTAYGKGDGSTTFNLPDLRGEFVRGFDDGRGIDINRVIGSLQADDLKSHKHEQGTRPAGPPTSQPNTGYSFGTTNYSSYDYGDESGPIWTTSVGGSETRPRNMALIYCIKY